MVMRAKEYLEINRKKICHYELVKKSIYDLYPLRTDKHQTEEYFNRYLFADIRYRIHLQNNKSETEFREEEDEINRSIANLIRLKILNAIYRDETFIYAYNIIIEEETQNDYPILMSYKIKEENYSTPFRIELECKKYKEDYPKTNLADYLLDDDNLEFYNHRKFEILKDEEWWLNAFNMSYELFDRARVLASDPFKTQYMVKNIYFNDKQLEKTVVDIFQNLLVNYTYDLTDVQNKKLGMLSDKIYEYGDERFMKIDDAYLKNIEKLDLRELNWVKATRLFNYEIIYLWANHTGFNQEQKLNVIDLIQKRYNIERQKHPEIFIHDLGRFFTSLREFVKFNYVSERNEGYATKIKLNKQELEELKKNIIQKEIEIEKLKTELAKITESVTIKSNKIELLTKKHRSETDQLRKKINDLIQENTSKGMTMPQQVLAFYYLFNELGITFNNSDKTQWARFINAFTGKNYQNIRTELNIDFDSHKTQKNLRIIKDIFSELFPRIEHQIINDSKE
jgi:hypothetical protein